MGCWWWLELVKLAIAVEITALIATRAVTFTAFGSTHAAQEFNCVAQDFEKLVRADYSKFGKSLQAFGFSRSWSPFEASFGHWLTF